MRLMYNNTSIRIEKQNYNAIKANHHLSDSLPVNLVVLMWNCCSFEPAIYEVFLITDEGSGASHSRSGMFTFSAWIKKYTLKNNHKIATELFP